MLGTPSSSHVEDLLSSMAVLADDCTARLDWELLQVRREIQSERSQRVGLAAAEQAPTALGDRLGTERRALVDQLPAIEEFVLTTMQLRTDAALAEHRALGGTPPQGGTPPAATGQPPHGLALVRFSLAGERVARVQLERAFVERLALQSAALRHRLSEEREERAESERAQRQQVHAARQPHAHLWPHTRPRTPTPIPPPTLNPTLTRSTLRSTSWSGS